VFNSLSTSCAFVVEGPMVHNASAPDVNEPEVTGVEGVVSRTSNKKCQIDIGVVIARNEPRIADMLVEGASAFAAAKAKPQLCVSERNY
jgi:hypothetical protein